MESKNNKISFIDFLVLTLLVLYIASASTLIENDVFTVAVTIFLFIVFVIKKLKFDRILFIVLAIWFVINFLSVTFVNVNTEFIWITFLGVTLRIIMPYLMLKLVGPSIMDKLLKYVFVLTIISLILFSIQILSPSLFYSAANTLNFITQEEQTNNGGWYVFIYMFSGWASERNCGFMWEPGGFAAVLIISLIYRLGTNNFKIDRMIIILLIALITTFSTAGYLALFFLIVAYYFYKRIGYGRPVLIIVLAYLFFFIPRFYQESEFMEIKIDRYLEQGTDTYTHESGIIRVSRLGIAIVALDYSTKWPFGNGIVPNEYKIHKYGPVEGPNSLAEILTQWGWLGIFVYCITFFRYYKHYNRSNIIAVLFTLSLSVVMFSNPFLIKYLIYIIFFYVYIFLNKSDNSFPLNQK